MLHPYSARIALGCVYLEADGTLATRCGTGYNQVYATYSDGVLVISTRSIRVVFAANSTTGREARPLLWKRS